MEKCNMLLIKNRLLVVFFLVSSQLMLNACQENREAGGLEQRLNKERYITLFSTPNFKTVNSLYAEYGEDEFLKLIKDKEASIKARFLASEILYHKSKSFPDKATSPFLAKIYADALVLSDPYVETFDLPANAWGFLYKDDYPGEIGKRLIVIGKPTVPYLKAYLTNSNFVLYIGSKEATMGNSYRYRIKDVAAFFIAKIENIPVTFYPDFDKRDNEIERLKTVLGNE